jgi:hypothetical protein
VLFCDWTVRNVPRSVRVYDSDRRRAAAMRAETGNWRY